MVLVLSACSAETTALTPAEILADGFVSDSEYLAAVEGLRQCVDGAGATLEVEFDRWRNPRFSAYGRVDLNEIIDVCMAQHIGPVEFAWADQNAPTPAEEAAFYDAVVSCVEEALGVDFGTVEPRDPGSGPDTSATDAAIAADPDLYNACLERQSDR